MSTTTSTNGKEIFDLLHDDIAAIEDQFGRDTISKVAAITEIGEYLRAGGGKRIRPALLLLSAKLLGYQGNGAVKLASVVEIIHTATLVHDDIIDQAQLRRGRPAANTQWGNSMCVLAGDWLYMQAFKIAVQERNFRILDVLVELTQQLVEGELLQMEKLGKLISMGGGKRLRRRFRRLQYSRSFPPFPDIAAGSGRTRGRAGRWCCRR